MTNYDTGGELSRTLMALGAKQKDRERQARLDQRTTLNEMTTKRLAEAREKRAVDLHTEQMRAFKIAKEERDRKEKFDRFRPGEVREFIPIAENMGKVTKAWEENVTNATKKFDKLGDSETEDVNELQVWEKEKEELNKPIIANYKKYLETNKLANVSKANAYKQATAKAYSMGANAAEAKLFAEEATIGMLSDTEKIATQQAIYDKQYDVDLEATKLQQARDIALIKANAAKYKNQYASKFGTKSKLSKNDTLGLLTKELEDEGILDTHFNSTKNAIVDDVFEYISKGVTYADANGKKVTIYPTTKAIVNAMHIGSNKGHIYDTIDKSRVEANLIAAAQVEAKRGTGGFTLPDRKAPKYNVATSIDRKSGDELLKFFQKKDVEAKKPAVKPTYSNDLQTALDSNISGDVAMFKKTNPAEFADQLTKMTDADKLRVNKRTGVTIEAPTTPNEVQKSVTHIADKESLLQLDGKDLSVAVSDNPELIKKLSGEEQTTLKGKLVKFAKSQNNPYNKKVPKGDNILTHLGITSDNIDSEVDTFNTMSDVDKTAFLDKLDDKQRDMFIKHFSPIGNSAGSESSSQNYATLLGKNSLTDTAGSYLASGVGGALGATYKYLAENGIDRDRRGATWLDDAQDLTKRGVKAFGTKGRVKGREELVKQTEFFTNYLNQKDKRDTGSRYNAYGTKSVTGSMPGMEGVYDNVAGTIMPTADDVVGDLPNNPRSTQDVITEVSKVTPKHRDVSMIDEKFIRKIRPDKSIDPDKQQLLDLINSGSTTSKLKRQMTNPDTYSFDEEESSSSWEQFMQELEAESVGYRDAEALLRQDPAKIVADLQAGRIDQEILEDLTTKQENKLAQLIKKVKASKSTNVQDLLSQGAFNVGPEDSTATTEDANKQHLINTKIEQVLTMSKVELDQATRNGSLNRILPYMSNTQKEVLSNNFNRDTLNKHIAGGGFGPVLGKGTPYIIPETKPSLSADTYIPKQEDRYVGESFNNFITNSGIHDLIINAGDKVKEFLTGGGPSKVNYVEALGNVKSVAEGDELFNNARYAVSVDSSLSKAEKVEAIKALEKALYKSKVYVR